ncbi:hypothetical protein OF377_01120 [Ureaplasma sp. ES3154-GEN]|uniref:hypothetical protein n=1 Tax=Ureaplasma sp. ES3154-GEN TaxID=2984844 RepID=UPI0021E78F28|nr:hypothetical protein [Ureaplasma sp. ES3154-GEN]MCV3743488.1 hypothetical protein [Ureaplasma sp. ES3154-GEN]
MKNKKQLTVIFLSTTFAVGALAIGLGVGLSQCKYSTTKYKPTLSEVNKKIKQLEQDLLNTEDQQEIRNQLIIYQSWRNILLAEQISQQQTFNYELFDQYYTQALESVNNLTNNFIQEQQDKVIKEINKKIPHYIRIFELVKQVKALLNKPNFNSSNLSNLIFEIKNNILKLNASKFNSTKVHLNSLVNDFTITNQILLKIENLEQKTQNQKKITFEEINEVSSLVNQLAQINPHLITRFEKIKHINLANLQGINELLTSIKNNWDNYDRFNNPNSLITQAESINEHITNKQTKILYANKIKLIKAVKNVLSDPDPNIDNPVWNSLFEEIKKLNNDDEWKGFLTEKLITKWPSIFGFINENLIAHPFQNSNLDAWINHLETFLTFVSSSSSFFELGSQELATWKSLDILHKKYHSIITGLLETNVNKLNPTRLIKQLRSTINSETNIKNNIKNSYLNFLANAKNINDINKAISKARLVVTASDPLATNQELSSSKIELTDILEHSQTILTPQVIKTINELLVKLNDLILVDQTYYSTFAVLVDQTKTRDDKLAVIAIFERAVLKAEADNVVSTVILVLKDRVQQLKQLIDVNDLLSTTRKALSEPNTKLDHLQTNLSMIKELLTYHHDVNNLFNSDQQVTLAGLQNQLNTLINWQKIYKETILDLMNNEPVKDNYETIINTTLSTIRNDQLLNINDVKNYWTNKYNNLISNLNIYKKIQDIKNYINTNDPFNVSQEVLNAKQNDLESELSSIQSSVNSDQIFENWLINEINYTLNLINNYQTTTQTINNTKLLVISNDSNEQNKTYINMLLNKINESENFSQLTFEYWTDKINYLSEIIAAKRFLSDINNFFTIPFHLPKPNDLILWKTELSRLIKILENDETTQILRSQIQTNLINIEQAETIINEFAEIETTLKNIFDTPNEIEQKINQLKEHITAYENANSDFKTFLSTQIELLSKDLNSAKLFNQIIIELNNFNFENHTGQALESKVTAIQKLIFDFPNDFKSIWKNILNKANQLLLNYQSLWNIYHQIKNKLESNDNDLNIVTMFLTKIREIQSFFNQLQTYIPQQQFSTLQQNLINLTQSINPVQNLNYIENNLGLLTMLTSVENLWNFENTQPLLHTTVVFQKLFDQSVISERNIYLRLAFSANDSEDELLSQTAMLKQNDNHVLFTTNIPTNSKQYILKGFYWSLNENITLDSKHFVPVWSIIPTNNTINTVHQPITVQSFNVITHPEEHHNYFRDANKSLLRLILNDPDNVLVGQEVLTIKFSNLLGQHQEVISANVTVSNGAKTVDFYLPSLFNEDFVINEITFEETPSRASNFIGINMTSNIIYNRLSNLTNIFSYRINLGWELLTNQLQTITVPSNQTTTTFKTKFKTNYFQNENSILDTAINRQYWTNLQQIKMRAKFRINSDMNRHIYSHVTTLNEINDTEQTLTFTLDTNVVNTDMTYEFIGLEYQINNEQFQPLLTKTNDNHNLTIQRLSPHAVYQASNALVVNNHNLLPTNQSWSPVTDAVYDLPKNIDLNSIYLRSFDHIFRLDNIYLYGADIDENNPITFVFEEDGQNMSDEYLIDNSNHKNQLTFSFIQSSSSRNKNTFVEKTLINNETFIYKLNFSLLLSNLKAGYRYHLKSINFKVVPYTNNELDRQRLKELTFNLDSANSNNETIKLNGTLNTQYFYATPLIPELLQYDMYQSYNAHWTYYTWGDYIGVYVDQFTKLQSAQGWGSIFNWLIYYAPKTPKVFTFRASEYWNKSRHSKWGLDLEAKYTLKELWIEQISKAASKFFVERRFGNMRWDTYARHSIYPNKYSKLPNETVRDERYNLSGIMFGKDNGRWYKNWFDKKPQDRNNALFVPMIGGTRIYNQAISAKDPLHKHLPKLQLFHWDHYGVDKFKTLRTTIRDGENRMGQRWFKEWYVQYAVIKENLQLMLRIVKENRSYFYSTETA